jgi:hypothetical protein
LISLLLISCCTKVTQGFFIVTKSRIFGQAGFLGSQHGKPEFQIERKEAWGAKV